MKKNLLVFTLAFLISFSLMPAMAFGATNVPYIDENGSLQSQPVTTDVTTSTASLGTAGQTTWYSVSGTVPISSRVEVLGDVRLILIDGAELQANAGIRVAPGNSLSIYAQSTGTDMGTLIATAATDSGDAGIGGDFTPGLDANCGIVNIYGGTVKATGSGGGDFGGGGAGIGGGSNGTGYGTGGNVYIYGGTVEATGGAGGTFVGGYSGGGAGIGGSGGTWGSHGNNGGTVTISGGTVTATGGAGANSGGSGGGAGIGGGGGADDGGGIGGDVKISGGSVKATGGAGVGGVNSTGAGIGGGGGNSLGANATGTIEDNSIVYASTIPNIGTTPGTNIVVTDAIVFLGTAGSEIGTVHGNTALSDNLTLAAGQTLTVQANASLTIPEGITLTKDNTTPIDNLGTIRVAGILAGPGTISGPGVVLYQLRMHSGHITSTPVPPNQFYAEGNQVNVAADTPSAKIFSNWSAVVNGANANAPLSSATSATSIVTMPQGAVVLTANYVDASNYLAATGDSLLPVGLAFLVLFAGIGVLVARWKVGTRLRG